MMHEDDQSKQYLCCPVCTAGLQVDKHKLSCTGCHRAYPVVDGIPVLLDNPQSKDYKARKYFFGRGPKFVRYQIEFLIFTLVARTLIPLERRRIIRGLGLAPGFKVMDHCTGLGGNLAPIAQQLKGNGKIVAMDISREMVEYTRKVAERRKIEVDIHQADALALPYGDGYFDAVIHSGAFNQFGNGQKRAVVEMFRVTRPGGTILIADEGLREGKYNRLMERFLLKLIPSFKAPPPVGLMPAAFSRQVDWVMGEMFYAIKMKKFPAGQLAA